MSVPRFDVASCHTCVIKTSRKANAISTDEQLTAVSYFMNALTVLLGKARMQEWAVLAVAAGHCGTTARIASALTTVLHWPLAFLLTRNACFAG